MLSKPPHISALALADPDLRYPWDARKTEGAYRPADAELMRRLAPISFRGLVALTLATAEWIGWRFEDIDEDEDHSPHAFTLCYVEAAWAGNVHMAYMRYLETDDDDWRGPAREPMKLALAMIVELMYGWRDHDEPERYPAWIANLARFVLPDAARAPFDRWLAGCIERLRGTTLDVTRGDDDDFVDDVDDRGAPVPRELFDLTRPFDPAQAPALLDGFVGDLDPDDNPFLHSADEIDEFEDWEGTISKIRKCPA